MKKIMVISLGGSQIIKDGKINVAFLKKFRDVIQRNSRKYKFVIVCGGGSVARMYIAGLKESSLKLQSFAGISATRTNARFVSYFFNREQLDGIPRSMPQVGRLLKREDIIFCGALEYKPEQTSDSTAAQIAREYDAEFVNITNVDGLFTSNPAVNKNAKLVREISWRDFHGIASKLSFKPGQHFVLDQKASKIIKQEKIRTYIVGNDLQNLDRVLNGKKFKGTIISD
jgi:uridylate kinase